MMNKKDIPDFIDARTYYDYLKLGDVNTKHYLMIAELIDNSISSFENYYGINWEKKLEINIEMKFSGNKINIHDREVVEQSYIKFTDNGFGMSKEDLIGAVKLNNPPRTNSKMNVHGRGLKQSAFFFGIDLTIHTNDGNGSFAIEQKLSSQKSDNEPYFIVPMNGPKEQIGTDIIIENIYDERAFSKATWENVKTALAFRYIKYLKQGKMNITFDFDGVDSGSFDAPKEPVISIGQTYDWVSSAPNEIDAFINKVKKSIDKSKKTEQSSKEFNTKAINKTFESIKGLFEEVKSNNQKIFEFSIDWEVQDYNVPVSFWMLPTTHSKYRGIRLFEGDRAINHFGFHDHETKPYMSWKKDGMKSGSTENRFAGSLDLSVLGLKSKTDKSSFSISDKLQSDLDTFIYSVWFVFDKFTMHARKENKNKSGKNVSVSEMNVLYNISETKFNHDMISYNEDLSNRKNNLVVFNYNSPLNDLWTIKIITNSRPRPADIVFKKLDQDQQEIEMTVYTGHPFWKNIDNLKSDFFTEAVYPITLLVATQYIEFLDNNSVDPVTVINNLAKKMFND